MSDFPKRWSDRYFSASADSSGCNCTYRMMTEVQCRVEPDENGKLQQKCEKVYREFKECAGQSPEIIERREEITNPNYQVEGIRPRESFGLERDPAAGLDFNELIEDFFRIDSNFEKNIFPQPFAEKYRFIDPFDREIRMRNPESSKIAKSKEKSTDSFSHTNPKEQGAAMAPEYKKFEQHFQEI